MKAKWILFLVFSTAYATNFFCSKFNPMDGIANEGEECALEEIGEMHYRKCAANLICEPARFGLKSFCVKETRLLFDGENCTSDASCYSKMCTLGMCKGKEKDKNCTSTAECAAELYCNGTCKETGKKCDENIKCASNAFCHINLGEKEGECYNYTSVNKGENGKFAAACKTYYATKDGICVEGPKLNKKTQNCSADGYCSYTYNGTEIKIPCVCSKDKNGSAVCPLGVGDLDLEPVLLSMTGSS